ncbi:radical SAM family heme chaperone HemW [Salinicoccus kekensis]|uniref:Heme chaperone HemW n=1 Tax=Salinicoccus kekensis TaxID=714307 RepID=A0A285U9E2_9STAP|nr:radical SAM family heme chaperone HemW [Salinicoccus kekensis]SOC38535.1 anaerobic coproporphyrinogen III oxidase [Salinicoccus kekensis]
MKSLYIHIPFCNRICTYCDFTKVLIKNQPVDDYIDALIMEMKTLEHKDFKTVYVGGGTPTALSEAQLERLLKFISENFTVSGEYTFEANPDEVTTGKLDLLKNYGVNRVSLGVQSFNDDILKVLNRSHDFDDIFRSIDHLEKIGLSNYSMDLMYNLPGETFNDIDTSLRYVEELKPKHISWYSLIIEPHTVFYNEIKKGRLKIDDDNKEAEKYLHVMDGLQAIGYPQYEISNFAEKEYESEHNKTYWRNDNYYGVGAGAHGYINNERYYNVKPVPHYIKSMNENHSAVKETIELSETEKIEEEMFLGLRMTEGVSKERFRGKFNVGLDEYYKDELSFLKDKKWITDDGRHIALTDSGRMVGNEVFIAFLKSS